MSLLRTRGDFLSSIVWLVLFASSKDLRLTFQTLRQLKPDIWLSCYAEFSGYEGKLARAASEGAAAWGDPQGYQKYITAAESKFIDTVEQEKAAVGGQR